MKSDRYNGCPNITYMWHGAWADPELKNDATGHKACYWDIEDMMWEDFCCEHGYDRDSEGHEDEFVAYCQENEASIQEAIEVDSGNLVL